MRRWQKGTSNKMDVVIDANILFSILIKHSKTEELLFQEDLHIFAPEFLFEEFEKYRELIHSKTDKTPDEFEQFLKIIRKRVIIIPKEESMKFFDEAYEISPDKNDAQYFALALKLKCNLWSNDKKLKEQKAVNVYSSEDLIKIFL